jgi:hypothetical protein
MLRGCLLNVFDYQTTSKFREVMLYKVIKWILWDRHWYSSSREWLLDEEYQLNWGSI